MPILITEHTRVPGNVSVWALPKNRWEIEAEQEEGNPSPFPFKFQLSTSTLYTDGAVKLLEKEMFITVPDGIDLLRSALETLQDKKREVLAEAEMRCQEIDKHIQQLQLLAYQPASIDDDNLEGEL